MIHQTQNKIETCFVSVNLYDSLRLRTLGDNRRCSISAICTICMYADSGQHMLYTPYALLRYFEKLKIEMRLQIRIWPH